MVQVTLMEFHELVSEAMEALPPIFVRHLDNVDVVVEDWPSPQVMRQAGVLSPAQLLGFYHGVPRTNRTLGYNLVPPDKISLYRRPIEMRCRTLTDLRRMVGRVLRHEIAHHFGIDDDRLREIGAY
jgi:predicted Zn-dependent protease with MMP-like domain